MNMTLFDSNAATIGIIGGADGPTAIFLTGDIQAIPLALLAVAALVVTLVVILRRRKRK
ncbi:MAG: sodium ion-translocating decarboxylase subunit beta [Oscillospiraceae bacterium]|nr:sodium ion-translocating decarboxylase subunit beta [Oscillospiraceae bacterium]